MKINANLLAAATAVVCGLLTVSRNASAFRNDILEHFSPGDLVTFTLNGKSGVQETLDGAISLEADDPFCVPAAGAPCSYAVNYIKLRLIDMSVDTDKGKYTLNGAYALIRGPLALVDEGNGITIPLGTRVESGATVSGPHVPAELRKTVNTVDQPVTIRISPVHGIFTLDGTLPFSFFVPQIDEQFAGSISGMVDGLHPFTNTAPFADAGPDVTLTCPQSVTLGVFDSSDLEDNIVQFTWTFDGPSATPTAFGSNPSVFFDAGTTTATLNVSDFFGGLGRATKHVTINLPPPSFGTVASAQVTQSCTTDASAVPISVPVAQVCGHNVPVTGRVTSFNGATQSIPMVNGTVDVPPGTGTIEFTASNTDGVTTTVTQTLSVLSPSTFFGLQGVSVGNGSTVNGTIYAGAGGQTFVQNDAVTGGIFSRSHVVLQDRVTVPSIDTNAGLTLGNNDHVGQTASVLPILPQFPNVSATFNGTQTVTVNPSPEPGDVVTLPPGQYGAVTVFSRGQLVLSSGTYDFASLDLEPQARLVTPSAQSETARLFVHSSVIYRGSTTSASGQLAPLYLAYAGNNALTIESPFTGTIIAPNAQLTLQSLNGQGVYTGEFFAAQVSLSPHTTVNSNPFTCVP